jgi:hypothetical protein
MASYIERRKFLATLGGAAAAWPLAARAQQTAKLPTIGVLGSATPSTQAPRFAAFVQRLRELGWIEHRTREGGDGSSRIHTFNGRTQHHLTRERLRHDWPPLSGPGKG